MHADAWHRVLEFQRLRVGSRSKHVVGMATAAAAAAAGPAAGGVGAAGAGAAGAGRRGRGGGVVAVVVVVTRSRSGRGFWGTREAHLFLSELAASTSAAKDITCVGIGPRGCFLQQDS